MKLTMKQKNTIACQIIANMKRRCCFKPGGIDMQKLEREAWDVVVILSITEGISRKDQKQIFDLTMEKGKYYA